MVSRFALRVVGALGLLATARSCNHQRAHDTEHEPDESVVTTVPSRDSLTEADHLDSDEEVLSLMVTLKTAFMWECHREDMPWIEEPPDLIRFARLGEEDDEMADRVEDDPHDIHDFEEFVRHQTFAHADAGDMWRIVSYGLHRESLGHRMCQVRDVSERGIRAAVAQTWSEYAPELLRCFWVVPQPEGTSARDLHFVVEVLPPLVEDRPSMAAALVMIDDAQVGAPSAYPAWIPRQDRVENLIDMLDLDDHCADWSVRACSVWIRGAVRAFQDEVRMCNGELIHIALGSEPPFVARESQWSRFFREFLMAHHTHVARDQWFERPIALTVHGISPANFPLGERELVLHYRQIIYGEWRVLIESLFPWWQIVDFGYLFCDTTASAHCHFHFILSFASPFFGVPVLITQSILTPWRPNRGGRSRVFDSEHWAMCVPHQMNELAVQQVLNRPPFWQQSGVFHVSQNGHRCNHQRRAVRWGDTLALVFHVDSEYDAFMKLT